MKTHTKHVETLERLIDECGLQTVLDLLAEICQEKAKHINTRWWVAGQWARAGYRVEKLSTHPTIVRLSA